MKVVSLMICGYANGIPSAFPFAKASPGSIRSAKNAAILSGEKSNVPQASMMIVSTLDIESEIISVPGPIT